MGLMVDLQPSLGRALVVGGGTVAARKVQGLVEAGFAVTVVAPEIQPGIEALPGVTLRKRAFFPADIDGHALVFACTDSREVNRAAGELARAAGVPVNVTDRQEESSFFSTATLQGDDWRIGISTGGRDPGLAKRLREVLGERMGTVGDGDDAQ
ncbi:MAG: bifunctional precorrin-2 dehydrogenase/sirohydrochlorin ferrochelatase [Chloroflexi bacterium]|nr:bifunctional precorrin-2 dehydrogenase/sirohydrochlorin ferrochelatase [Chloroflexota bacterium]